MDLNLNNLINVTRFSGFPLIKQETVSDHVWGMIALALEIVPENNLSRSNLGLKLIDLKELIYKIVVHDLDEAFYCDIPRPFKHYNKEIKEAINNTAEAIMKSKLPEKLFNDIIESKSKDLEGLYVKLFDLIQCGLKMTFECDLGNKFILSEIPNVISSLTEIKDELSEVTHLVEIKMIEKYINNFNSYLDA